MPTDDPSRKGESAEVQIGDKYTGGAMWGRSTGGTIVFGTCDTSSHDIQFVKNFVTSDDTNSIFEEKIYDNYGIETEISKMISKLKNEGKTQDEIIKEIYNYYGKIYGDSIINRPFRVCNQDGTWGPIYNPCVEFKTCVAKDINTKTLLEIGGLSTTGKFQTTTTNNNGVEETKELLYNAAEQLATKNLSAESINNSTTPPDTTALSQCKREFFEVSETSDPITGDIISSVGQITANCNLDKGEWENIVSTCKLRTCSALSKDEVLNILIEDNKNLGSHINTDKVYYIKSSGYNGNIQLPGENTNPNVPGLGNTYVDYKQEIACPTGYDFCSGENKNGKSCITSNGELDVSATRTSEYGFSDNGKLLYVCDVDVQKEGEAATSSNDFKIKYLDKAALQGNKMSNNPDAMVLETNSWTRYGQCVPQACTRSDLDKILSNYSIVDSSNNPLDSSAAPTDLIANKTECQKIFLENGQYSSCYSSNSSFGGGVYSVGTKVNLTCKTGYYNVSSNINSNGYAECEYDNTKQKYQWKVKELQCIQTCNIDELNQVGMNVTKDTISKVVNSSGNEIAPQDAGNGHTIIKTADGTDYVTLENKQYFANNYGFTVTACKSGYDMMKNNGTAGEFNAICRNGQWTSGGECLASGCWVGNIGSIYSTSPLKNVKINIISNSGNDGLKGGEDKAYGATGGSGINITGNYNKNLYNINIIRIPGGNGGSACDGIEVRGDGGAGGNGGDGYAAYDSTNKNYIVVAGGGGGGGGGSGSNCSTDHGTIGHVGKPSNTIINSQCNIQGGGNGEALSGVRVCGGSGGGGGGGCSPNNGGSAGNHGPTGGTCGNGTGGYGGEAGTSFADTNFIPMGLYKLAPTNSSINTIICWGTNTLCDEHKSFILTVQKIMSYNCSVEQNIVIGELPDNLVAVDYGSGGDYCRVYLKKGSTYTCDNNLCGDSAYGKTKQCNSPGGGTVYAQEGETFTLN